MFSTTPIALMKTTKLVPPALMNGKGRPVGGIEPDTTCYCTKNYGVNLFGPLNKNVTSFTLGKSNNLNSTLVTLIPNPP